MIKLIKNIVRPQLLFCILIPLIACSSHTRQGTDSSKADTLEGHAQYDTATFAGGCFWCVEASFEQIEGVVEAVSGYTGGEKENPTYKEVGMGLTNHAEAVQVFYDPEVISYEVLLDIFFTAHDPTQLNRQGPDVGKQYRSAIFYHSAEQKKLAEAKMERLGETYKKPIVTELEPLTVFYKAEDYHQDYEKNHPENPYIQSVSKPKIERVAEAFQDRLKRN